MSTFTRCRYRSGERSVSYVYMCTVQYSIVQYSKFFRVFDIYISIISKILERKSSRPTA